MAAKAQILLFIGFLELLSETTMGFTEFNAIKSRATAEGEWKWKKPRHLMRTGEATGRDAAKIESVRALRLALRLLRARRLALQPQQRRAQRRLF